jgi:hypothetical protein
VKHGPKPQFKSRPQGLSGGNAQLIHVHMKASVNTTQQNARWATVRLTVLEGLGEATGNGAGLCAGAAAGDDVAVPGKGFVSVVASAASWTPVAVTPEQADITGMRTLCTAAKWGSSGLFSIPDRTDWFPHGFSGAPRTWPPIGIQHTPTPSDGNAGTCIRLQPSAGGACACR